MSDRRFWDVRVWWTDPTRGRWQSGCNVSVVDAATAHQALAVCIDWRGITADLDGFHVELINPDDNGRAA